MDIGQVLVSLVPTAVLVVLFKILRRAIRSERWQRMRGNEVISVAIALCFVIAFVAAMTTVVLTMRGVFSDGSYAVFSSLALFLVTVLLVSRALDLVIKPLSAPSASSTTMKASGAGQA